VIDLTVTTLNPLLHKRTIPSFSGTPEARLRSACIWVSKNCPGRQLTLEEIGTIMGVTRERVRQIEAHALRKLRHPSRICFLSKP
jgi:hypothetical protein